MRIYIVGVRTRPNIAHRLAFCVSFPCFYFPFAGLSIGAQLLGRDRREVAGVIWRFTWRGRTREYALYANRRAFPSSRAVSTGGARVSRVFSRRRVIRDRREITAVASVGVEIKLIDETMTPRGASSHGGDSPRLSRARSLRPRRSARSLDLSVLSISVRAAAVIFHAACVVARRATPPTNRCGTHISRAILESTI